MKLMTDRDKAALAANEWYIDHLPREGYNLEIWEKLKALGSNPNPADVEAIIGNKGWTATCCDYCDRNDIRVWITIHLPNMTDGYPHEMCLECAGKIVNIYNSTLRPTLNPEGVDHASQASDG